MLGTKFLLNLYDVEGEIGIWKGFGNLEGKGVLFSL